MLGGSDTPRGQNKETLQILQPPPVSQGRLNTSRSEDRATGYDNEVVLGHQKTSEEVVGARESAAAATAPTIASGAPSEEENRLARVGEISPHARENA